MLFTNRIHMVHQSPCQPLLPKRSLIVINAKTTVPLRHNKAMKSS